MEVIFLYNIENLRDQDSESTNQINCLEEHHKIIILCLCRTAAVVSYKAVSVGPVLLVEFKIPLSASAASSRVTSPSSDPPLAAQQDVYFHLPLHHNVTIITLPRMSQQ